MTKVFSPTDEKARLRLWLRLLDSANSIEREVRTRLREKFNVTLPQFDLMAALDQVSENEGLSMGQLSERLRVSNGNVTGVVNRLVKEELAMRWSPPEDRRTSFISLTKEGRARFREMAEVHQGWIDSMLGDLSDKDMEQLADLLGRTQASVERDREDEHK